MKLKQTWDLDCCYPGGSSSPDLREAFKRISTAISRVEENIKTEDDLQKAIKEVQVISLSMREMGSVITCLNAQNTADTKAHLLRDQITALRAQFNNLSSLLGEWLASLEEKSFQSLIQSQSFKPIAFSLKEKRKLAQDKLPPNEESFINALAVDGFHGWEQMWEALIGNMTFPFQGQSLSFGQIENQLSDLCRAKRSAAFQSIEEMFCKYQTLFAQTLNHLSGFRLAAQRKGGRKSILKEPLEENRMKEETLQVMWSVSEEHQSKLKSYLECKAGLLNLPQISWIDLEAPLGKTQKKISYDEAGAFIIEHFSRFSSRMGSFAKEVLHAKWIDAESRTEKQPGSFCVSLPITKQSRIFMTYADTMTNVFTLAHELGHAFHNSIVFSLPAMAQDVRMNVAETASAMAEIIITRAAAQKAQAREERLFILDNHLSRTVSYLMNIRARFLFETRFYQERTKGYVTPEILNELMVRAQQEAYGGALSTYHPLFWAAKMHFYITDTPFYNFPYTFGYLFSLGIYELAAKQDHFEEIYISLLLDTGSMTVEDLAQKHLGVDLTKPTFWKLALSSIDKDIDTFLALATEKMK